MSPRSVLRLLALASVLLLAGCSSLIETVPSPTPLDFGGIAGELAKRGVAVEHYRSGDAGCTNATLIPTAIGFDASGLDQTTPTHVRIFIFRDRATFERRRSDVDACAASWVTEPSAFESIEASPYVLVGQGPWGPKFAAAAREALVAAAGNGG